MLKICRSDLLMNILTFWTTDFSRCDRKIDITTINRKVLKWSSFKRSSLEKLPYTITQNGTSVTQNCTWTIDNYPKWYLNYWVITQNGTWLNYGGIILGKCTIVQVPFWVKKICIYQKRFFTIVWVLYWVFTQKKNIVKA